MTTEKDRRIYYQHIVYAVCDVLDQIDGKPAGTGICCGTADQPSMAVEKRMLALAGEITKLRSAANGVAGRKHDAEKERHEGMDRAGVESDSVTLDNGNDPDCMERRTLGALAVRNLS